MNRKHVAAIIGRPNVGKSTLFNKLIGQRIAIVDDKPGVTRDRIYGVCEWLDYKFTLIDTGGIEPDSTDEILVQMKRQAEVAIELADVIIFVVDIRQGLVAGDTEVVELIRKSKKPIVLACNKADTPGEVPHEAYEFYNLGIGDPFCISSIHGMGVGDLLDEVISNFEKYDHEHEDEDVLYISVIGKPNVGKSSIINKISGEDRVIVSNVPGTTRDAIDTYVKYNHKNYCLIDTAGLRKKKKIFESVERYSVVRSLAAVDRSDICIVMIDASEGVTEQDTKIAGYAHENGKGIVVAVNKWDLIEKNNKTVKNFTDDIREKLSFLSYAPIEFISAKTGQRINKLFETIDYVSSQQSLRISTGVLNDIINEAVYKVQPPSDKGRRLKIMYATQTDVKPPTFVIFVNDITLMHFSYERYLKNQIRERFKFDGTSLKFIFRERGESNDG